MGDGTPEPLRLPGSVNYGFDYRVDRREDDERTQEEQIQEAIDRQAADADYRQMYPNAFSLEENLPTFEKFEGDYNQGVGEDGEDLREVGRYDNKFLDRLLAKMRAGVKYTLAFYNKAYIPLKSEHVDENGNIRFDARTEAAIVNYMNHVGLAPEERYIVNKQVIKALGFTPDRKNMFFSSSEREKIDDEVYIEALNNMMLSWELYGHPYGFVNRGMFLGNTRCYPIAVPDPDEVRVFQKSGRAWADKTELEVLDLCAETWLNETLPQIRKNIYRQPNGEAQMIVLEDFVRSLASLWNISPRKFGVADEVDRGYNQMMAESTQGYRPNEDEDDIAVANRKAKVIKLAKMRYERSFDRLDRQRNRTFQTYDEDVFDKNGNIIHHRGDKVRSWHQPGNAITTYHRNSRANTFGSVCMSVANMAKFAGVVGYIPIMASGIVEHAQGNVNTIVANNLLFNRHREFRPNDAMYAHITSEAGVEAISAWKSLLHVGGQDALRLYSQEYGVLNKENAQKFINDFVKQKGSEKLAARKLKDLMNRAEEAVGWLMPGIGFNKADAKRWLEGYMINNMLISQAVGKGNLPTEYSLTTNQVIGSFTADQVLEMMDAMGIERFMASVTETNAGRDAMLMTRNQTFDRVSPLNHIIDNMLRRAGIINVVITLGIDTYFTYGLNLIQLMIPFSNTASYLAVKGINMVATGGRNNLDKPDLDILNYQMGGNDAFGAGLRKNLIYDCVKLGNICLIAGFMYFVVQALGFDEPEDEGLKYVWSEYRIGRNINLGGNDANGNPTGIPVYAAWWLNDLTMFALPMAYALHASQLDQKLGEKDPELGNKLFISGCHDMLSGCSLLDLMKTVTNARKDFESYEQAMNDPDMKCPPDWFSFGLLQAELFCARGINKFVPNALKSLQTETLIVGEDALDHDPRKVYDREAENPGKTKYVEDWFEIQRRVESKYNPIYALYNNLTKNHYLFDDGTTSKTGYLYDEMPISTAKDPARMYWANKYDYDPDNIPGGEENRIPYTESLIDQVIADIESFDSVEDALSQGYMIPAELRFRMSEYCSQHINFEENLFNERLSEGWLPTEEFSALQQEKKDRQNYWKNIRDNWVWNKDIPWTDEGYAKLITSSQDVYFFKDTNKPASKLDYWELGGDMVEQRFIPRGDHPTSLFPFTTPDGRGRGYNYETLANWFREGESGSNLQEVFERLDQPVYDQDGNLVSEHATVPFGRDAGVFVNSAIFGGNRGFAGNEPSESTIYGAMDRPTMGYRGYVPWEDSFLFDLPNFNGYVNEDGKLVRGNGSPATTTQALFEGLKQMDEENASAESSLGDMGVKKDKEEFKTDSYPSYSERGWTTMGKANYYNKYGSSRGGGYGRGSGGSSYNPKIYSTKSYSTKISSTRSGSTRTSSDSRSVSADRADTMGVKLPGDARANVFLRPAFTTKGSREAYKRQDI